jgi:hypothetical protein
MFERLKRKERVSKIVEWTKRTAATHILYRTSDLSTPFPVLLSPTTIPHVSLRSGAASSSE